MNPRVLLVVLDGWGLAPVSNGNAIALAKPSFFNSLWNPSPHVALAAAGDAVGLLKGMIGNSEVGHLHMGAGRVVEQDAVRITKSIASGAFYSNQVLRAALRRAKERGRLHIMGLASDAAVHSQMDHLLALIVAARRFRIPKVFVHAFMDGRDTSPVSGLRYIKKIERALHRANAAWHVASVCGRYYAMDRDKRWHRTRQAYDLLVNAKGRSCASALEAVKQAYDAGETDEFIRPRIIDDDGAFRRGDVVLFFNFRADRARQITRALTAGSFKHFPTKRLHLHFVCMTHYGEKFHLPVMFKPVRLHDTLGETLAKHDLRQFRLAETEKKAHVTFFFNGLSDRIFRREERFLVPSPKVTTYDKKPAMSAFALTDAAVRILRKKRYAFVLLNLANADLVGHSGSIPATIKAVRAVDACLATLVHEALACNYAVLVTADHGNAERKLYPDGSVCTAHSANKVPLILIGARDRVLRTYRGASLIDIAPTVLDLLHIKKPRVMRGTSLLKNL